MKNTTFRKKALLSSVAMLLVALVALGSATFAWFTQNKTVTADGLILKATTSAGLQILSGSVAKIDEDAWDTQTVLDAVQDGDNFVTDTNGENLGTPLSLNLDKAAAEFYTTLAGSEKEHDKSATANIDSVTDLGSVTYVEDINVRSSIDTTEGVNLASVAVSITTANVESTNLTPALRVTLVDAANNVVGTWGVAAPANDYLDGTAVKAFNAQNHKKNFASGDTVNLTQNVKYAGYTYKMIVWLDGEDQSCYTQNVANLKSIVSGITVTFTAA